MANGKCDDFVVTEPIILGHESSATVVGVGSGVTHLKVGDRVAVEPGVPCGQCEYCTGGRYNLCRKVEFQGCPPYGGSLRRVYNHRADFCLK